MVDPNNQPPPGMRPDGTLIVIEPGEPIPQPKILMPDGRELTPAELDLEQEEDDLTARYEELSDLDEADLDKLVEKGK